MTVTEGVGGTGVVGLLHNGDGPTVLLRADMDALPMEEATGLAYESHAKGVDRFGQPFAVAHACGHDMHVAWLMGASRILAENRHAWHGTAMVVFQPGEETSQGARSMVSDGMVDRFPKPDVALAQHVMPLPAGRIGHRSWTVLSSDDSWEVTLYGRGAHGSMPQMSIDPVVMAAATVMRLQTIVSREVAMTDGAVVTVGALQAGTTENVIPDKAVLRLNIRTFDPAVREWVLGSVRRIIEAEATASTSCVLVLAFVTAVAGGILRDLPIGAVPPAAFESWHYLGTPFGLFAVSGAAPCFLLRLVGIYRGWNLPRPP